ncbi:outer membrane beta-barrel protein [Hymenobacter sp. 15J16-1T3B]|uniref:outer membrane beta-barrel protein n=1 Tax=Hymenobacter sp. 15J16-1T3B TaxID=2886941 RepID=UPI001D124B3C|nr:outer membrane beta-barrel protein [Hymenobacter sp. 15J16-1T3B]MCC3159824.1 outer membrane beta-barrel protein [Hymenobacter sp. 15J16-1T3B]
MKSSVLLLAGSLLSGAAQVQAQTAPAPRPWLVGVGLTAMSGYYIRANESLDGVRFAPNLHAQVAMSPRVALQGAVAYQKRTTDRDESGNATRYVQHKETKSTVVPVLLRVTLGPLPRKAHVALLGGLTFRHSDLVNQETYYNTGGTYPGTFRNEQLENRLDVFFSLGAGLRYQVAPRWAALADIGLNFRLGGEKTQYYELLPASTLAVGVGYSLGAARP